MAKVLSSVRGMGSHSQRDARKKNGNLNAGFADRGGDHAARNVGHHQGWKGKMGGLRTQPAKSLWTIVNLCCLKATKCVVSVTAATGSCHQARSLERPFQAVLGCSGVDPASPPPSPVSKDP